MPSDGLQEIDFVHPSFGKLLKDRRRLCLRHLSDDADPARGRSEKNQPPKTRENNVGENMISMYKGVR